MLRRGRKGRDSQERGKENEVNRQTAILAAQKEYWVNQLKKNGGDTGNDQ